MIVSAKQILDAGLEGKWLEVTPEEAKAVVDSIAGENMIRGSQGKSSLRSYERNGCIVVVGRGVDAETHPDDVNS